MTEITDKIRAMLRKADESHNDSEEERDTAMRMAQRLLLKHGLTMADVGNIADADGIEGRAFEHDSVLNIEDSLDHWCGNLMHAIGDVYFCKVYYTHYGRGGPRRWYVVGRADHVEATLAMFDFVEPQLQFAFDRSASKMHAYQRDARKYALSAAGVPKEDWATTIADDDGQLAAIGHNHFDELRDTLGADFALLSIRQVLGCSENYAKHIRAHIRKEDIAPTITDNLGVWRRSWFDAAISRVKKRLKALREEEAANLSGGTDLVVSEQAALDAALDRLDLGLHKNRSQRQTDLAGAMDGDRAGKSADLSGHQKLGGNRTALGAG